MNIYVGNLPYSISEDELQEIFGEFGEVTSARIINDKMTGRSKGFAFVEMANDGDAKKAIEALNEKEMGGRKAVVNEARPRQERPEGGGFRGGDRGGFDRGDRGGRGGRGGFDRGGDRDGRGGRSW